MSAAYPHLVSANSSRGGEVAPEAAFVKFDVPFVKSGDMHFPAPAADVAAAAVGRHMGEGEGHSLQEGCAPSPQAPAALPQGTSNRLGSVTYPCR